MQFSPSLEKHLCAVEWLIQTKWLWSAQSQKRHLYHTPTPKVPGPSRKRGQKDSESWRLEKITVKCHLLGMMGYCAYELTAAKAIRIRPGEDQAREPPSVEEGKTHEVPPLAKELFVAGGPWGGGVVHGGFPCSSGWFISMNRKAALVRTEKDRNKCRELWGGGPRKSLRGAWGVDIM